MFAGQDGNQQKLLAILGKRSRLLSVTQPMTAELIRTPVTLKPPIWVARSGPSRVSIIGPVLGACDLSIIPLSAAPFCNNENDH